MKLYLRTAIKKNGFYVDFEKYINFFQSYFSPNLYSTFCSQDPTLPWREFNFEKNQNNY